MWTDFREVENDLPKTNRKLENEYYVVYVTQYEDRLGHGPVTRLMIVPKPTAPCLTQWRDYQIVKDQICGPEREAVEFYPRQSDLRDHGHGYHLWVLPEGKTLGLGFSTPKRPRNIFIDAGAHIGVKTREALEVARYDVVYAFEPDKNCLDHFQWSALKKTHTNLNLIKAAVWTEEATLPWYTVPGKPQSQSASVMATKTSGGIDTTTPATTVRACDFAAWLMRTVRLIDHVHLKMDIEGAEFDVLEHLIETKAIALVDRLTIEWHATKLAGTDWEHRKANIQTALIHYGIDEARSKGSDE